MSALTCLDFNLPTPSPYASSTPHPLGKPPTPCQGKWARSGLPKLSCCKNLAEYTRGILNGDDLLDESPSIDMKRQVEFWKPLFGQSSACISRSNSDCHTNLCLSLVPSQSSKLKKTVQCLHDVAPGFDGMSKSGLCALNSADLDSRFNSTSALVPPPPSYFKVGITTMVPEQAGEVEPSDFHPITLSPIISPISPIISPISPISRLFHRILARRLSVSLNQEPRQKAFIRRRDALRRECVHS